MPKNLNMAPIFYRVIKQAGNSGKSLPSLSYEVVEEVLRSV